MAESENAAARPLAPKLVKLSTAGSKTSSVWSAFTELSLSSVSGTVTAVLEAPLPLPTASVLSPWGGRVMVKLPLEVSLPLSVPSLAVTRTRPCVVAFCGTDQE